MSFSGEGGRVSVRLGFKQLLWSAIFFALPSVLPVQQAFAQDAALFVGEVSEQAASQSQTQECLLQETTQSQFQCRLLGEYRALEFESQYGELVARLERASGAHDLVSLRGFLREQDLDSELVNTSGTSDDATLVAAAGIAELAPFSTSPAEVPEWQRLFAKFEALQGARYEIPANGAELKTSLGFDAQAEIATADWLEVLKVHIERSLGVGAETSELIVELLGVSSNPVVVETN